MMFNKQKREQRRTQRLYEQSLREVDSFVAQAIYEDAVETRLRRAAQRKIEMVRHGMEADGVTPDTDTVLRFAQTGAESYLESCQCTKYEAERVHEIFQQEYDHALNGEF